MNSLHELQLVNTLGHSAGAIIFGIFLYLLLRDRAGTRLRGSWLSVAAASLAFLWNVGSLAVLITPSNDPVVTSLIQAIQAHASNGSEASQVEANFSHLSAAQQQEILDFLRSL